MTPLRAAFWLVFHTACTIAVADAQSTVLQDLRIIDGNGGPPLEHRDIVIEGTNITKLLKTAPRTDARAGTTASVTIINLSGKTALPGLISDHSHLGMVDGKDAGASHVTRANILRQLKQYEAYGVTTVTSLGLNLDSFYELQPQLHAGTLPGADMFGADRGFGVTNGAPPASMGIVDSQVYRPATPTEARQQVRDTALRHPALIKLWVDDFHGAMPTKLDPGIYRAIIDEAHKQGLRVAAHVYYLDDAKQLVADGVDILAHGVRDRLVDAEFVGAMKARRVWYIPTLGLDESFYRYAEQPALAGQPFLMHALQPALAAQFADAAWQAKVLNDSKSMAQEKQALAVNEQNLKILFDAGVAIGFGTDSGATPLRIAGYAEHRELALMTEAGLSPLQALGIATHNAARLLNLADRGVLAAGKLADVLIVDGDPASHIEDTDRIAEVWHRGKRVAGPVSSFAP